MKVFTLNLKRQLMLHIERSGLTQSELARKAGVSKQVISQWLGGAEPRKLEQVKQVADVFGITLDELCFGPTTKADEAGSDFIAGVFEIRMKRIK